MHRFSLTVLLFAAITLGCSPKEKQPPTPATSTIETPTPPSLGPTTVCPVCGLTFQKAESIGTHKYQNKIYHFLLKDHQQAFTLDPERYISSKMD